MNLFTRNPKITRDTNAAAKEYRTSLVSALDHGSGLSNTSAISISELSAGFFDSLFISAIFGLKEPAIYSAT